MKCSSISIPCLVSINIKEKTWIKCENIVAQSFLKKVELKKKEAVSMTFNEKYVFFGYDAMVFTWKNAHVLLRILQDQLNLRARNLQD